MKYNKYRVSPKEARTWNGTVYASKAEMEYAKVLDGEVRLGVWDEVIRQTPVRLGPIDMVPDFAIRKGSVWRWCDIKGAETPEFKLKKKLWRSYGPGELVLVRKSGKTFKVYERIIPDKKNDAGRC